MYLKNFHVYNINVILLVFVFCVFEFLNYKVFPF